MFLPVHPLVLLVSIDTENIHKNIASKTKWCNIILLDFETTMELLDALHGARFRAHDIRMSNWSNRNKSIFFSFQPFDLYSDKTASIVIFRWPFQQRKKVILMFTLIWKQKHPDSNRYQDCGSNVQKTY